ncbi:MAG TPA: SpaA isopeptide-forming pilin-related protein [Aeromicrobium sp.]|nr:SpaA isopeptide-forming pilin-related protein [Aeromicrobium sp.]
MYQASVRSTTAETGKTLLAIVAIFSLLLSMFAMTAQPVSADGEGSPTACLDTTAGVTGSINSTSDDLATFTAPTGEVVTGVCIKAGSFHSDVITANGPVAGTCFVVAGIGTPMVTVTRSGSAGECSGLSHIDVVTGPAPSPTLTVEKQTVGGDSDFQFTLDDVNVALLSDNESDEVATTAGNFDLAEVLSQAQIDAGWSLTSIECSGNAAAESVTGANVNVTVGANEDVTCVFTNTLTPPPDEGFVEVDKLICLAAESSTDFVVENVVIETFATQSVGESLDEIGDCILGADVTFEVYVDANGNQMLDEGEVLSDDEDLIDGTLTTNENGAITVDLPEGDYILVEPAGGIEEGTWPGGSVAFSVMAGELTLIEVTNNIAEEGGLLKIRKFFCTIETPEGFTNPHFIVLEGQDITSDAALPDEFAENCTRGGENPEATFEIDGKTFETTNGILVISLPPGTYTLEETEPNEGSIQVTITEDGVTSVLVLNFEEDVDETGSITVDKEIECDVCETFTPGFFFNQGENNEGFAFADDSLMDDPIEVAGITFDSVQKVQDESDPGSLLRHYLALTLNVRMGGTDCDLLSVVYDGSVESLRGETVATIWTEAGKVLNGQSSAFSAEDLHDAIDEINNAESGDGTLVCDTDTSVDGFTFELTGPEGPDSETRTGEIENGTLTWSDLPLGTYTLEETGGPDGSDCTVVSASGDGVEFDAETGVITITLTSEMADVTVTVVNDCGGEGGEETELGSITILKNAVPDNGQDFAFTTTGTGLSGFSLDDDADAVLSNQKVFTSLGAGTYSVTESVTSGWDLTSITCSAGGSVDMANRTANITLAEGANVTCTFVNTLQGQQAQTGSITILKNAVPDDAQDFAFTTTGTGLSGFSLDDDANATLSNQKTFSGLAAGMYTVAEGSVTGWTLTSLTCSPSAAVTITGSTASINLAGGANVTCTFVNTKQGSGTLPNQAGPTTTPRQGTLAGNLPNTATEPFSGTPLPVALVALLMLSGLGAAAYAMKAEAARRR